MRHSGSSGCIFVNRVSKEMCIWTSWSWYVPSSTNSTNYYLDRLYYDVLTQAVFESEGSKVRKRASVLLFDKKFSKPYIQVFEPILFEKLMKKVVSSLQFSETHIRKRRVCAFAASYLTRNISNFSSCVLLVWWIWAQLLWLVSKFLVAHGYSDSCIINCISSLDQVCICLLGWNQYPTKWEGKFKQGFET